MEKNEKIEYRRHKTEDRKWKTEERRIIDRDSKKRGN